MKLFFFTTSLAQNQNLEAIGALASVVGRFFRGCNASLSTIRQRMDSVMESDCLESISRVAGILGNLSTLFATGVSKMFAVLGGFHSAVLGAQHASS
jgi:hypothetical protein